MLSSAINFVRAVCGSPAAPSQFADVKGDSDSVSDHGQGNGMGVCPSMIDAAPADKRVCVETLPTVPLENGDAAFEAVRKHLVQESNPADVQTHMAIDLAQL